MVNLKLNLKIFLDDVRNPPDSTWILYRDPKNLITFLFDFDNPKIDHLSLDHDLGLEDHTGYTVIFAIESALYSGNFPKERIPEIITCHSANPVGKRNIEASIASIQKFLAKK